MEIRNLIKDLWIDEKGINQCFMQIEINDGTEIWTKAERLISTDVARIMNSPTGVDEVSIEMANRAVLVRPLEKIEEENRRLNDLETAKQETLKLQIELANLNKAI